MSEHFRRCRYYPRCLIHRGENAPRHFSESNKNEMREMRDLGATVNEIAKTFGGNRRYIGNLLLLSARKDKK